MERNFWKIILAFAVVIRIIYFSLTPPGQLPDEKFIFRRIWTNIKEPTNNLFPDKSEFYYANNEYYYPPLYYSISSLLLTPLSTISNHLMNIEDAFDQSIYILRVLSLFLSFGSLILIWKIIEKLNSNNIFRLSVFSFIALLPSLASFSIAANQNNLALFLTTLFICLSVVKYNRKLKDRDIFIIGLVFGLSLLTKFDSIITAPFILLNISTLKDKRGFIRYLIIFSLSVLMFGGWWYVINLIKDGWFYDKYLFAFALKDYALPFSSEHYLSNLFGLTIISFFAIFGIENNIALNYQPYLLLELVIITSMIAYFFKTIKAMAMCVPQSNNLNIKIYIYFTLAFIFNLIIFLLINFLNVYQPQGRYFFNSIIFLTVAFVLLLFNLLPRKAHKSIPIIITVSLLILNILGFGCNLQYFHNTNIFPRDLSCVGNYLPVGEIKSDLVTK